MIHGNFYLLFYVCFKGNNIYRLCLRYWYIYQYNTKYYHIEILWGHLWDIIHDFLIGNNIYRLSLWDNVHDFLIACGSRENPSQCSASAVRCQRTFQTAGREIFQPEQAALLWLHTSGLQDSYRRLAPQILMSKSYTLLKSVSVS